MPINDKRLEEAKKYERDLQRVIELEVEERQEKKEQLEKLVGSELANLHYSLNKLVPESEENKAERGKLSEEIQRKEANLAPDVKQKEYELLGEIKALDKNINEAKTHIGELEYFQKIGEDYSKYSKILEADEILKRIKAAISSGNEADDEDIKQFKQLEKELKELYPSLSTLEKDLEELHRKQIPILEKRIQDCDIDHEKTKGNAAPPKREVKEILDAATTPDAKKMQELIKGEAKKKGLAQIVDKVEVKPGGAFKSAYIVLDDGEPDKLDLSKMPKTQQERMEYIGRLREVQLDIRLAKHSVRDQKFEGEEIIHKLRTPVKDTSGNEITEVKLPKDCTHDDYKKALQQLQDPADKLALKAEYYARKAGIKEKEKKEKLRQLLDTYEKAKKKNKDYIDSIHPQLINLKQEYEIAESKVDCTKVAHSLVEAFEDQSNLQSLMTSPPDSKPVFPKDKEIAISRIAVKPVKDKPGLFTVNIESPDKAVREMTVKLVEDNKTWKIEYQTAAKLIDIESSLFKQNLEHLGPATKDNLKKAIQEKEVEAKKSKQAHDMLKRMQDYAKDTLDKKQLREVQSKEKGMQPQKGQDPGMTTP